MKRLGLIISTIILFFIACEKEEEYSEIPLIKYKGFVFDVEIVDSSFVNQVGYLTFEFIDGNGDLGFYENPDTINDTIVIIYDILIREYTKINDNYIITDSTNNNYWLPYFEEGIYRKHIKGSMQVSIYFLKEQVNDTVKYEFQIMDREYQLSNLESTPEFIVPEWN